VALQLALHPEFNLFAGRSPSLKRGIWPPLLGEHPWRKIWLRNTQRRSAVPPHWFIPVKASDAKARKGEVDNALKKYGNSSLQSFWKTPDGQQLYAIVNANELTHDMLRDIGANGKPIAVEDV
jgi:hypothetical protein